MCVFLTTWKGSTLGAIGNHCLPRITSERRPRKNQEHIGLESARKKEAGREEAVLGSADHRVPEKGRIGRVSQGVMPTAWILGGEPLPVAQQFGGMDVSDAKRLKALEAENARLKKLLAESVLENEVTGNPPVFRSRQK